MSQQLFLKLGHPSENPKVLESMEVPGWSMMSSTTGWLRSLWADDYLDRVLHPECDPITLEDCQVANAARHKFCKEHSEWQRKMLKEGRGSMRFVEKSGSMGFVLNEGEKDPYHFIPRNAKGETDARLYAYDGDIRVPTVNVDGDTYLAGARGNDRRVIVAEIMGTAFTNRERHELLERINSPKTWDQMLCHRMRNVGDLGDETERLIREGGLSDASRENLLYNLSEMRKLALEAASETV
jgi:hypothetical protein